MQCKIYPGVTCNWCGKWVFHVSSEFFNVSLGNECHGKGNYGIACDLGSTNICTRLYDLDTGKTAGSCSLENPERLYGKDVITRQAYALNHEEGQEVMHRLLIEGINRSAAYLCEICRIEKEQIKRIVTGGNTTISHFLLNLDIKGLTENPFTPSFTESVCLNSRETGIEADAELYLPGNLGGHVGSDITAGLLNDTLLRENGLTVYVDIGTNGEIVLKEENEYLVTSVAAGPVFEEGYLDWGVKAAGGAVSEIRIGRNLELTTIGENDPCGICGSGIVSGISAMVKAGIIDRNGKLADTDEMKRRYASKDILDRIDEEHLRFYITDEIYISQEDIRKFLLAKAAIRAGIKTLLKEKGRTEEDIEKLVITGALGNHVSTEALVRTGIIPETGREKVQYIENGALEGLSLLLLGKRTAEEVEQIRLHTENIFLNETETFEKTYINEMYF